ncbi:MAG: amino acid permease [Acidobacteria bacterium]|nr:amino acid permease [Acidobacteriota bacterium]
MQPATLELKRQLDAFDSASIVIGCVIGSGIFIVPALTASQVGSTGLVLLVWIVAGALSLCGALAYAELGASLPAAGGQYVYLREAYGRMPAFLYGWTLFLVIHAGGMAALGAAFAIYLGYFVPLTVVEARLASVGLIVVLVVVNCLGVRLGARVQNVLTAVKVVGVAAIVFVCFAATEGSVTHFVPLWGDGTPPGGWAAGVGAAMVGALWAYEGWHNFAFVAGETVNPERNVPLALVCGVAVVMALYLAATLAYLYVLPFDALSRSTHVAADAMRVAVGPAGGTLISLLILLSVTGAVNGMTLAGPRAYYAMARDGLFFPGLQRVDRRFGTPVPAIVAQGVWASVLAASGRYDQLFTYVIFAAWIFYAMTVAAVIVLRRRHPEWRRPYLVWGYPVLPALFVIAAGAFVLNTLVSRPRESAWGAGIVLLGVPAYFLWRRRSKSIA